MSCEKVWLIKSIACFKYMGYAYILDNDIEVNCEISEKIVFF